MWILKPIFSGMWQGLLMSLLSFGPAFFLLINTSIKDGYNDIILAGGAEASITPLGIGGFSSMKALSTCSTFCRIIQLSFCTQMPQAKIVEYQEIKQRSLAFTHIKTKVRIRIQ